MKIETNNLIYGIALILAGIAFFLATEGIIDFSSWWGAFLFIPGILSLVLKGSSGFNIFLMVAGTIILTKEFFNSDYILPIIFILVGLGVLFSRPVNRKRVKR